MNTNRSLTAVLGADQSSARSPSVNWPIFVVGSSRSGTTFLASILASSHDFPLYKAETKLLSLCSRKYGPLQQKKSYQRFIKDWLRSSQFARSGLDAERFIREAEAHRDSYAAFLAFFMGSMARNQAKTRWLEKTPEHIFYIRDLSNALPNARFIHIIRDGRDVAISRRKVGWVGTRSQNERTQLLCAAIEWERAVKAGRRYGEELGKRYLEINYEALVRDTERVLEVLNPFAGTQLTVRDLNESSIGSLRRSNSAFAAAEPGVSNSAVERWREMLSEGDLYAINTVIGRTLTQFGYGGIQERLRWNSFNYWRVKIKEVFLRLQLAFKHCVKRKTPLGRIVKYSLS